MDGACHNEYEKDDGHNHILDVNNRCVLCNEIIIKECLCDSCFMEKLFEITEDNEAMVYKIQDYINQNFTANYEVKKFSKGILKDLKAKQAYLTNHMYEMKSNPNFEAETKQVFKELIEKYEKKVSD